MISAVISAVVVVTLMTTLQTTIIVSTQPLNFTMTQEGGAVPDEPLLPGVSKTSYYAVTDVSGTAVSKVLYMWVAATPNNTLKSPTMTGYGLFITMTECTKEWTTANTCQGSRHQVLNATPLNALSSKDCQRAIELSPGLTKDHPTTHLRITQTLISTLPPPHTNQVDLPVEGITATLVYHLTVTQPTS
jgi:hypothetical protein